MRRCGTRFRHSPSSLVTCSRRPVRAILWNERKKSCLTLCSQDRKNWFEKGRQFRVFVSKTSRSVFFSFLETMSNRSGTFRRESGLMAEPGSCTLRFIHRTVSGLTFYHLLDKYRHCYAFSYYAMILNTKMMQLCSVPNFIYSIRFAIVAPLRLICSDIRFERGMRSMKLVDVMYDRWRKGNAKYVLKFLFFCYLKSLMFAESNRISEVVNVLVRMSKINILSN